MYVLGVVIVAIYMDDISLIYLPARIAVASVLYKEYLVASKPVIFSRLVKFSPEAAVTMEHDDAALRRIILRCMVVPYR